MQLYKTELFINLTDEDICQSVPSVCGPNSTCIKTIGSYSCYCQPGFAATNSSGKINVTNPCTGKSKTVIMSFLTLMYVNR